MKKQQAPYMGILGNTLWSERAGDLVLNISHVICYKCNSIKRLCVIWL